MNDEIKKRIAVFNRVLKEIPQIIYIGNPILRQRAKRIEIAEGQSIGDQLGNVLAHYREITGTGRGLAAPQIGINKAVFVTLIDGKLQTFINPVIIDRSKETNFYKEVCISTGILSADVQRSEWIMMEWVDVGGVRHKEKVEGLLARLYQHEEAHLRGFLNLDEASPQGIEFVTFDPLKEKLRQFRNQSVS